MLRDEEGTVHVIPNGAITTLANRSMNFSYYVVNLPLAYGEDTEPRRRCCGAGRGATCSKDDAYPAVHPRAAGSDWRGRVRGARRPAESADEDGAAEAMVRRPRVPAAHSTRRCASAASRCGRRSGRWRSVPGRSRRRRLLALRLLDDLDAGAGADPRRPGRDHRLQPLVVADAAGRLDAHVGADDPAHQRDVGRGRAAGGEAGGRLHEIRAHRLRQRARRDLLVVVQQRDLDDHLADDVGLAAGTDDGGDVALDDLEIAGLERADVDHHVDLGRAVEDRAPGLVVLDVGGGGAQRESDDRADADARAAQQLRRERDPGGIDADGREVELRRLARTASRFPGASRPASAACDRSSMATVPAAPPVACRPIRDAPASSTPRRRSGQQS